MAGELGVSPDTVSLSTTPIGIAGYKFTAIATGDHLVSSIKIKKDVMEAGDVDMLQDLIMTAVNESLKKAKAMSEEEMQKITGGMSMPGLF